MVLDADVWWLPHKLGRTTSVVPGGSRANSRREPGKSERHFCFTIGEICLNASSASVKKLFLIGGALSEHDSRT